MPTCGTSTGATPRVVALAGGSPCGRLPLPVSDLPAGGRPLRGPRRSFMRSCRSVVMESHLEDKANLKMAGLLPWSIYWDFWGPGPLKGIQNPNEDVTFLRVLGR
ncbi:hypothetical protein B296_00000797 [Ensete ventricosum]|uniref:Uncharacterized protein n=1 Tax=Ensete ventricosum TaxID=4639 RepID=A0A426ZWP9_ENSVE|nr:hypothetical protein B296_00000797 [Ensete ventricosum]